MPHAVRAWAAGLGIETFVGSSRPRVSDRHEGRAAAARLAASAARRAACGSTCAIAGSAGRRRRAALRDADGEVEVAADAVVLALGGASWPRLGSDGAWVPLLRERGIAVAPLRPANCGFDVGTGARISAAASPAEPLKPVVGRAAIDRGRPTPRIAPGRIRRHRDRRRRQPDLRRVGAAAATDRSARSRARRTSICCRRAAPRVRARRAAAPARPALAGQHLSRGSASPASRPACCANCCRAPRSADPTALARGDQGAAAAAGRAAPDRRGDQQRRRRSLRGARRAA